jgi:putative Holliday junction resolvase
MPSPPAKPGRVAGIDFGTVRIGIAISDPARTLASPYENYARGTAEQDAERFRRLVAEEEVTLFVVGLPVHLDGRESEKSRQARQFGQWLADVTGVAVEYFDERFTSTQAEQALLEAGMTSKRRKKRKDMLSAQIMLGAYLESHGRGADAPGPLDD